MYHTVMVMILRRLSNRCFSVSDQVLTLHPDTQEHVKLIQGLDETIGLVSTLRNLSHL